MMLFKYFAFLLILAAVSAESKIDSVLTSTGEIFERGPKVIEKILDEGKVLNNRFSKRVVSELVMNIKEFREALKKCEEDASNPNNSLYMLQNFSNLLQVGYKTFRSLADTNFTDGMVAVRQSIDRIKREIDESRDAKQKLLKIDYFN